MLVVVAIVCLDTFSFFAEPEDIVKLTIFVRLGEIDLVFDACKDVSVVSFPRGLNNVDVHLCLSLGPVFDTVPILQDQTRGTVGFLHRDPAVALVCALTVDGLHDFDLFELCS